MHRAIKSLFPHEREALLSSLRRDLRTEKAKSQSNTEHRDYHGMNVQLILRILDILNPKTRN
jgi:hypothetical protein